MGFVRRVRKFRKVFYDAIYSKDKLSNDDRIEVEPAWQTRVKTSGADQGEPPSDDIFSDSIDLAHPGYEPAIDLGLADHQPPGRLTRPEVLRFGAGPAPVPT